MSLLQQSDVYVFDAVESDVGDVVVADAFDVSDDKRGEVGSSVGDLFSQSFTRLLSLLLMTYQEH